jgi:hypothetical protein
MTTKLLLSMAVLACMCVCQSPPKPASDGLSGHETSATPHFACNLKAFTPQQRAQWRKLIDQLMAAVTTARELTDGYSLHVDTGRVSLVEAAQWVELERKCCPFFNFQLDLHGEDGSLWLSLKGREGVKQFIEMDFTGLRDKLGHHTPRGN